jgi:RNA polymerase sigma-70 factor (ECF subfamily)
MIYEDLDDLELARRISTGDEKALKSLYDTYADLLYGYIRHFLNEIPDAVVEDIWQETLISVIKGLSGFRGNSKLFTWMCGIAKHKAYDYCRLKKYPLNPQYQEFKNGLPDQMDTNLLPEDYVLQQAIQCRVIKTLGTLPVTYRAILIQRYIDGLSVLEIARSIGKSYKATESLLSRARLMFKSTFLKLSKEQRHD